MSQVIRVYQRPEVDDEESVDGNGTHVYTCEAKDYSIKYEAMFNCKFRFGYSWSNESSLPFSDNDTGTNSEISDGYESAEANDHPHYKDS